jgi:hypothetical protein
VQEQVSWLSCVADAAAAGSLMAAGMLMCACMRAFRCVDFTAGHLCCHEHLQCTTQLQQRSSQQCFARIMSATAAELLIYLVV